MTRFIDRAPQSVGADRTFQCTFDAGSARRDNAMRVRGHRSANNTFGGFHDSNADALSRWRWPRSSRSRSAHTHRPRRRRSCSIGVGGKTLFYYLPLTIAERNGYFKAEGPRRRDPRLPRRRAALQALLGGSVDVVSGAYEHTITQQAKGQIHRGARAAGQVRGHRARDDQRRRPPRTSRRPISKGMKIGVTAPGSSTNMFVNVLLAKAGLKPDAVAIIGVGATAGAVAIMKRGEIDAISNLDPVISQLEADGTIVAGRRHAHGQGHAGGLRRRVCGRLRLRSRRFREEISEHGAGHRQRDGARAALHPGLDARPDRRRGAAPSTTPTRRCTRRRSMKNLDGFKHDGFISHDGRAERLPRSQDVRSRRAKRDRWTWRRRVNMTFQQKAAQKYK